MIVLFISSLANYDVIATTKYSDGDYIEKTRKDFSQKYI